MVFQIIKQKIQNSYFNKWEGEQKFLKNPLKFDRKFSTGIIEKQSNAVIEYMF